jgi:ubiquinol-cytochrome c reductase cytochrome b subunit
VLDRPSERPVRTALGVVVLTFYAVLLLAGGQDIWAQKLDVSLSAVLWTFRVLVFVLPVLTGAFTYKLCRDLERHRHAAREAERAEPPVAVNEEPLVPPSTIAPPEAVPKRRRFADTLLGVMILWILRRAGGRRERVRR